MSAIGDLAPLKTLIETHGRALPAEWQRDVETRFERLGLPRHLAFIFPALGPSSDGQEIKDVALFFPSDPLEGLMRLKGKR